ncbi:uncharacterized protein F4812DRAFT_426969, partial [Daldinia caldariorum]|uniref:uncharacterized protein n=1 Tax=Daldinia caldariorum TaxID=326644 RepID=UPI00200745CD
MGIAWGGHWRAWPLFFTHPLITTLLLFSLVPSSVRCPPKTHPIILNSRQTSAYERGLEDLIGNNDNEIRLSFFFL